MSSSNLGHKLAVVIATMDRPVELENLLTNIEGQSFRPDQIIVVDGGDPSIREILDRFPSLSLEHLPVHPPALTRQKNAGVSRLNQDIDLVGFIDDDVRFEVGALKFMMSFWDSAPEHTAGASFNLTDFSRPWSRLKSLPQRLFFIDNRGFGRVRRSGFNTPIWNVQEDSPSQWLGGGYTVWRKKVFDRWQFDEWYPGSGLWEDVHFSYRVGKKFALTVVSDAKAAHVEPPMTPNGQFKLGKTQIVNWVHFVESNPDLSLAMCLWACVGRTAANLAKGLVRLNRSFLLRGFGNASGLATASLGVMVAPLAKGDR